MEQQDNNLLAVLSGDAPLTIHIGLDLKTISIAAAAIIAAAVVAALILRKS